MGGVEGGETREHFFRNSEFGVVLNKENGFCTSFGVYALAKPATLPAARGGERQQGHGVAHLGGPKQRLLLETPRQVILCWSMAQKSA